MSITGPRQLTDGTYCTACGARLHHGAAYCTKCGSPVQKAEATRLAAPMVPARLGGRGLAWLVDILIALGLPNALGAFVLWGNGQSWNTIVNVVPYLTLYMFGLFAPIYYALFHAANGQTLGKRLARIRVVAYDGAASLRAGQSLGRSYLQLAMFLLFGVPWIVDTVWPLFQPERRALHDLATGTIVVPARTHPGSQRSS